MGRARVLSCLGAVAFLLWTSTQRLTGQVAMGSSTPAAPPAPGTSPPVAYDVVTIRPNHQGPGSVHVSIDLDVYYATNVSLMDLLRDAYHLHPGQLQGQPKWADDDRYDIHAKTLEIPIDTLRKLTPEDRERMMRDLLADRFHLQTHTEMRTLSVLELVPAKGGPLLQPIQPQNRQDPFYGVSPSGLSSHNVHLIGHYLPIERLTDFLSFRVDRIVLDKTGLPGMYNLQLNWTPDDQPLNDDTAAPPPLFTALEQQLGLKLVPAKASVSIVVIDHVEPPTDN